MRALDPMPSWERGVTVSVRPPSGGDGAVLLGVPVAVTGRLPAELGVGRDTLRAVGFEALVGQAMVLTPPGRDAVVAVGIGDPARLDAAGVRDAAAAFARCASTQERLVFTLPQGPLLDPAAAAQAAVEGALLARYRYPVLKDLRLAAAKRGGQPLVAEVMLLTAARQVRAATEGARRGELFARAAAMARDLATAPPSLLTAVRMAECAARVAGTTGLDTEIFDRDALLELGCGGLLGVNAGSADPPRMIRMRYRPEGADGHVTLVGKGIMYDSGGISLKPADAVHATMKNDMSGAGAILAAMAVLPALGCRTAVTGYLMCTDNMPSGTATKLGDVLTMRGGTTVEVLNTDAEGRLVMADALVLATEEPTDAIVDIATLTGACLRALGPEVAGVFGNDRSLLRQVCAAALRADEPVWQLPLDRRYRGELESEIADLKNVGGPNGMAIHAALFLAEFVGDVPWAHLDIAGPAQCDTPRLWRTAGCTGFGTRLLLELLLDFTRPGQDATAEQ
ncbi:leucyl aminopeptidase [Catellatospora tritici]|uniref:leucyl aminopeptidase n=1 Tax=Catellatospora tritici TaxID=2851566 RepID=UPI0027DEAEFE|nr:leucyl aminopeptidase [Catellatospora tritici]